MQKLIVAFAIAGILLIGVILIAGAWKMRVEKELIPAVYPEEQVLPDEYQDMKG